MSEFIVPPPNSFTAFDDRKPVLYRADGTALVRHAGFVPQGVAMPVQTRGTTPALMTPKVKKGGKKGGKRGC